ncbi:hypothetical protein M0R45_004605 [Rubus argutus]|uniref:Uncharacterized protein n=1 Tax=Rubus argutus TaxID=59490 RepID=A0AAW1YKD4_RUBAR
MAWRCGSSLSRSLISTARTATVRSSPSISSLPRSPPLLRNLSSTSRRTLLSLPANVGQLACAQSLLPLHSAVASARMTSHISGEARAFCELSQGTSIDPSYLTYWCWINTATVAALGGLLVHPRGGGFRAPYLDKIALEVISKCSG